MAKLKNWHKGNTTNPLYSTWNGMIIRCTYPSSVSYKNYGGRGIKVCERWYGAEGLANFVVDMGPRPTPLHTLDRINNDGNYEPSNCQWATRLEQMQNARPRGNNSRNTSGVRGVYFDKRREVWRSAVTIDGARKFSPGFKTIELARQWYADTLDTRITNVIH